MMTPFEAMIECNTILREAMATRDYALFERGVIALAVEILETRGLRLFYDGYAPKLNYAGQKVPLLQEEREAMTKPNWK